MRWAGLVAQMRYNSFLESLREDDNLEDLVVDMRIILQYFFKKLDRRMWTGLFGSR
jgi:hypothetical protein